MKKMQEYNENWQEYDENWNKSDKDFIDYKALRKNTEGNHYPKNFLHHFEKPVWDEELQTWRDSGSCWYRHLTPETEGQIPHLHHRSNNEKRNGNDFEKNPKIITSGCSVTTAVGLPHDFAWPEIVRHITGKTVNNVSHSGASVAKMVHQIFAHIERYGQPEEIQMLLPELTRGWVMEKIAQPKREEFITLREIVYSPEIKSYISQSAEHGDKIKPYIHDSFEGYKTLIPMDMVVHESMRALEHLIMHCKITGTKIKIFSWDKSTDFFLHSLKLDSYVTPPQHLLNPLRPQQMRSERGWPPRIEPFGTQGCCDLKPVNKYQRLMWEKALDGKPEKKHVSHPGLHQQIHIAEIFLNTKIEQHQIERITPWYTGTHLDTL